MTQYDVNIIVSTAVSVAGLLLVVLGWIASLVGLVRGYLSSDPDVKQWTGINWMTYLLCSFILLLVWYSRLPPGGGAR